MALAAPASVYEGTVASRPMLDETMPLPTPDEAAAWTAPAPPIVVEPPVLLNTPAPVYPTPVTPAPPVQPVRPPTSGAYPRAVPPRKRRSGGLWWSLAIGMLIGLIALGILFLVGGLAVGLIGPPGRVETTILPFGVPTNTTAPAASGNALVPIALSGRVVYTSERDGNFDLYVRDLTTGEETRLTENPGVDVAPAPSPDGNWIAFASDRDGDFDIYVVDVAGQTTSRKVVQNSVDDFTPAWTPDSQSIVYASDAQRDGATDLYQIPLEGGEPTLLYASASRDAQPRWIGEWLYFVRGLPEDAATWEIYRMREGSDTPERLTENAVRDAWPAAALPIGIVYSSAGAGESAIAVMSTDGSDPRTLYDGPGFDWGGVVSDDGRWLAFTSDEEGLDQVYLMPVDGSVPQELTTGANGAFGVAWLPT